MLAEKVVFALGWDTNRYDGDEESILMYLHSLLMILVRLQENMTSYSMGSRSIQAGALTYSGDNRTGEGNGDDEIMTVELEKDSCKYFKISFAATIYDAENRLQNFGMVDNSYIRAYDADTNEELFRYDVNEDFSLETGVVAGEMYRRNGEWKFNAVGSGFAGGLAAVGRNFGLNL